MGSEMCIRDRLWAARARGGDARRPARRSALWDDVDGLGPLLRAAIGPGGDAPLGVWIGTPNATTGLHYDAEPLSILHQVAPRALCRARQALARSWRHPLTPSLTTLHAHLLPARPARPLAPRSPRSPDTCGAQVSGTKRVTLYDPSQSALLYDSGRYYPYIRKIRASTYASPPLRSRRCGRCLRARAAWT